MSVTQMLKETQNRVARFRRVDFKTVHLCEVELKVALQSLHEVENTERNTIPTLYQYFPRTFIKSRSV